MPILVPPDNVIRRERLLLYGAPGSGKSYAYQRILASTPDHVQFHVIDTDAGWEPAAAEEFAEYAHRVTHYEPMDWPDYLASVRKATEAMDRERGDWLVVDLADQAWTEVQDWWHERKYGDDFEAAIDDDNDDPMNKWGTINKAYAPFAKALIRVPGNVLVCATEKELKKDKSGNYFRESRQDIRDFGSEGVKPGGQKKLSHDLNTTIRMSRTAREWKMTVVKDRNRMPRWGDQPTRTIKDFPLDFLVGIAGWRPA